MLKMLTPWLIVIFTTVFFSKKFLGQVKNEEWLQIDVADTAEVIPEEIILAIAFPENDDNSPTLKKTIRETTTILIQKIRKIGAKYTTDTLLKRESYLGDNFFGDYPIQLFTLGFASTEKLKLFKDELSGTGNIKTFVFQLKSSKTDFYDKELFKKVLDKAWKEAAFISELVNKKIIKIAELKTSYDSDEKGEWVSYPPLSMIASYKNINTKEKIILMKKITVKFSWQDK